MLTERQQRSLRVMERRLQMPKRQFVLKYGVILWAIPVTIFIILFEYFYSGKSLQQQWNEGLLVQLIIFPVGGMIYGYILRNIIQKQYDRLKAKDNIV